MGQTIPNLYIVIPNQSNPNNNVFGSIQEAINASDLGTTIILTNNLFQKEVIYLKSGIKFIGLDGATIISSMEGLATNVVFENIIFKNSKNAPLKYSNIKGVVFRNCTFVVETIGDNPNGKHISKVIFGILLSNSSALFQGCSFLFDVENANTFVMICIDNSPYVSLQSPIIRTYYRNIHKVETYFFRVRKTPIISYFEASSSSIHYSAKEENRHCAVIRLFRGLGHINASLIGTKILFEQGSGKFDIATGDEISYINGLTAIATCSAEANNWEIGDFSNIFLTSFMSNLKYACEIQEKNCTQDCILPNHCIPVPLPSIFSNQ